ncbi:MAG: hypothetical protein ACRDTB_09190, partial [Actinophytocola sp.]
MLTVAITSTATTAVAMYQPRLDGRVEAGGDGVNAGAAEAIAGTGVGVPDGPCGGADCGPDCGPESGPEGGPGGRRCGPLFGNAVGVGVAAVGGAA